MPERFKQELDAYLRAVEAQHEAVSRMAVLAGKGSPEFAEAARIVAELKQQTADARKLLAAEEPGAEKG